MPRLITTHERRELVTCEGILMTREDALEMERDSGFYDPYVPDQPPPPPQADTKQ